MAGFWFLFVESGFIIIIMTIDSFDVLDKEAKQNSGDVPKLGARLQSIERITNQTIMFHHENHHRPFPSCESEVRDGDGPTCTSRSITIDAYDVAAGCSRASVTGGGAVVRAVQPFDISSTSAPHLASKSPGLCFFSFKSLQSETLSSPFI